MTDFNDDIPDDIRQAFKAVAPKPSEERVDRVWARLREDVAVRYAREYNLPSITARNDVNRGTYSGKFLQRLVGYGATAALLVLGAFGLTYLPNLINIRSSVPDIRTYTTAQGERANITLADGSNVILAPATTIRVAGRNVELTGEAVFTVSPNRSASFTVKAGNSVTHVLGTTFGIRAYPTDKSVRVAVAVGRVSVASAVLSAGDIATIQNNESIPLVASGADMSSAFAWTSGRLVFDRAPLPDAFRDLQRWYNVRFVIGESLLIKRYITTTLGTQSLDEAISILSAILDARVERTPSAIIFYPR